MYTTDRHQLLYLLLCLTLLPKFMNGNYTDGTQRSYVGGNVILQWWLPHDVNVNNFLMECYNERGINMYNVVNSNVYPRNDAIKRRVVTSVDQAGKPTFTLTGVTMQDAGDYSCKQVMSENSTFYWKLFVWGTPSNAIIEQDDFRLICKVNSTSHPFHTRPPLTYTWWRNDTYLTSTRSKQYLYLTADLRDDIFSNFSCEGREEGSLLVSGRSDRVYLSPPDSPEIDKTWPPDMYTVDQPYHARIGDSVTLIALFTYQGQLACAWNFDSQILTVNQNEATNSSSNKTVCTLKVNIEADSFGDYVCTASDTNNGRNVSMIIPIAQLHEGPKERKTQLQSASTQSPILLVVAAGCGFLAFLITIVPLIVRRKRDAQAQDEAIITSKEPIYVYDDDDETYLVDNIMFDPEMDRPPSEELEFNPFPSLVSDYQEIPVRPVVRVQPTRLEDLDRNSPQSLATPPRSCQPIYATVDKSKKKKKFDISE